MKSILLATTASVLLLVLSPVSALAAGDWRWPVSGEVLTHYRNGEDPYAAGQHRGIDIGAAEGTEVVSATPGLVRFAGVAGASGQTVSVRTADGRYDVSYLHLSRIAVREGERVEAGAPLGAVGVSGARSATAPHLHFGVRDAGTEHAYRDPLELLGPVPAAPVLAPLSLPGADAPRTAAVSDGVPAGPLAELVAPAPAPLFAEAPAALEAPRPPVAAEVPEPVATAAATPGRAAVRARGRSLPASPGRGLALRRGLARPAADARAGGPKRGDASPPRAVARSSRSRPGSAAARLGAAPSAAPASSERRPPADRRGRPLTSAGRADRAVPVAAPASPSGGTRLGWWAACAGLIALALVGRRSVARASSRPATRAARPRPERRGEAPPVAPEAGPSSSALAAPEAGNATSIEAACPSTSRHRSTTSTRSLTSATRTRRSRPTSSLDTCASAGRTSSS
ncbi:MAG: peptidoglycan DD-metalloendopeptidase family protein [Thermoleophilaceae bacterium]